jgi:hypothetical protein
MLNAGFISLQNNLSGVIVNVYGQHYLCNFKITMINKKKNSDLKALKIKTVF